MAELAQIKMLQDVSVPGTDEHVCGEYKAGSLCHVPEWLARHFQASGYCEIVKLPQIQPPPVPEYRQKPIPPQQTAPREAVEARRVRRDQNNPEGEVEN